jgi:hypothetical protein
MTSGQPGSESRAWLERNADMRVARVGHLLSTLGERGRSKLRSTQHRVGSATRGMLAVLGVLFAAGVAAAVLQGTHRRHSVGHRLDRWLEGK